MIRRLKPALALLWLGLCSGPWPGALAQDEQARELWSRLRQVQSVHATKLGWGYEATRGDSEDGGQGHFRLRHPVSIRMSAYAGLEGNHFSSSAPGADDVARDAVSAGLSYNRRNEALYAGWELDRQGRPGAELEWLRPVRSEVLVFASGRRRNDRDGYLSVLYGEVTDEARLALSWDPRSPLFVTQEFRVFQSTLRDGEDARGSGSQWILQGGLHFERRPDRRMGWQFRSMDLRNEASLGEYVEINVVQSLEQFSAGQAYLSRLARPGRAAPFSVGGVLSHPISEKMGFRLGLSTGMDAQRDLNFTEILNLQAALLLVPGHRQQILLNFEHSTENAGVVSGDISRVNFSFQWNL